MKQPSHRARVAIYMPRFLPISATFVYRQLLAVAERFDVMALAAVREHADVFPFDPVVVQQRTIVERWAYRVVRTIGRSFRPLPPSQRRAWSAALASHRAALIHAHFGPYGLDMLPLARRLGLPLLVTFHGFDASSLLRNRKYVRDLRGLFEYAHLIAVSREIEQVLIDLGAPPGSITQHYIGVPLERFRFVERQREGRRLSLLQVANFVEKKGHEYTLRAFARFRQRHPEARLTLAGDGPLRGRMETLSATLGLGDSVAFAGKVSQNETPRLMAAADVFVHHSVTASDGDREGLPTVIQEAMATGLVVVATRHAGIPEILTDGANGFLVDERDVEGYAAALERASACDASVGRSAAETIREGFDMLRQNERLVEIYARQIERSPSAGDLGA